MLFPDSYCCAENLLCLDSFPEYSSCIKSFGKSIIPPLISAVEKEKLRIIRAEAVKKEAACLEKRNLNIECQQNAVEFKDNFLQSNISAGFEPAQRDFNASELSHLTNPLPNIYDSRLSTDENEMLVSTSKIPSSNVCSTVHKGVIVSPTVSNKDVVVDSSPTESISSFHQGYCSHAGNLYPPEYHEGVAPCVPYENLYSGPISSVSEDEQGSFAEETEFGSLPTVICVRKSNIQDTDSESNVTCATQSTDLEKYMDCSIEYSSPEELALERRSHVPDRFNMSSRSDDASSETLMNTEGELTPSASAMAQLAVDVKSASCDLRIPFPVSNILYQRAYSVDSYLTLMNPSPMNSSMKKSQSEPAGAEGIRLSNMRDSSGQDSCSNFSLGSSFATRQESVTSDSDFILPEHEFQRRHVRKNSYTLDQPSPALIMAHADCNCKEYSSNFSSPHCSITKLEIAPPSNPAFKKEQVNIVLPPTPERDKFFPILRVPTKSSGDKKSNNLSTSDTSLSYLPDSEYTESDVCQSSSCVSGIASDIHIDQPASFDLEEVALPSEQEIKKPPAEQNVVKNEDVQAYIEQVLQKVRDDQKVRVNQLIEQQDEQWRKLQEEFTEQERLLYEKLSLIDRPSISGSDSECGSRTIPVPEHVSDMNNCDSTSAIRPDPGIFLDASSEESSEVPMAIQNNRDASPFLIPENANDIDTRISMQSDSSSLFSNQAIPSNFPIRNLYSSDSSTEKPISSADVFHADLTYSDEVFHWDKASCVRPDSSQSSISLNSVLQSYQSSHFDSSPNTYGNLHLQNKNLIIGTSSQNNVVNSNANPSSVLSTPDIKSLCCVHNDHQNKIIETVGLSSSDDVPLCHTSPSSAENDLNVKLVTGAAAYNLITNCDRCAMHSNKIQNDVENGVPSNGFICDYVIENSCSSNGVSNLNHMIKVDGILHSPAVSLCYSSPSKGSNQNTKVVSREPPGTASKGPVSSVCKSLVRGNNSGEGVAAKKNLSLTNLKRRHSRDITKEPELLKKFEKLPAFVKGYLMRRLYRTERVQDLIKTLQETAELIGTLSGEFTPAAEVSDQDVDFHRQLIVQLISTFHDVYDIFCTITIPEQMQIIAESRNLRSRKKSVEKQESTPVVREEISIPSLSQKPKLSAATLKSLERKRRSTVGNRTYTVEDLRNCNAKSLSSPLTKTRSASSPSRIYKSSSGTPVKRKICNVRKVQHWR